VFCWRQPFRSQRWPDQLPADAHGRRGVLLVHGFVCNRGLWNPWLQRLRRTGRAHVAVNLEPVFGSIDDYVARLEPPCGGWTRPPAWRRWWWRTAWAAWRCALVGPAGRRPARCTRCADLGTPHHGTWLAVLR
jgi:triacylglycerol lipase